jgi:hypothetical protein
LLLALLLTAGGVALLVFVVWVSGKIAAPPPKPVGGQFVDLAREGENGGNRQAPGGTQLDNPSDEPSSGKADESPDVQNQLDRLDLAAVTKTGSLGSGGGKYGGTGPGEGWGDRRDRPPGSPAPPARHWEVLFGKGTLDDYARQLDFFKIELGVLQPGNKIVYARNLAKPRPDTREVANPVAAENRYYLTWRNDEMQQADRDLLAKAGIDPGERLILKFLPAEVEQRLAALEASRAGTEVKRIQRTRFGVRAEGGGFAFFVLEQSLRR